MTSGNEDRAKLKAILEELGITPTKQVTNGVQIVFGGIHATLMIYGDDTLSLACSVKGGSPEWELSRVNAANNRVRFAKFSVERGNLLLEADFVYYLGASDAVESMKQVLDLWRMALHELQALVEEMIPA